MTENPGLLLILTTQISHCLKLYSSLIGLQLPALIGSHTSTYISDFTMDNSSTERNLEYIGHNI